MNCCIVFLLTMIIKWYTCTSNEILYVLPDNLTNASCPSHPCATLNQYLLYTSGMSNVKFLFLSGKHSLTSNITMQHVHNVTMIGMDYSTLTPTVILSYSFKAVIDFVNASNIMIANLVFKSCGDIGAIMEFSVCYYCNIANVTFIRYGVMITNLLGESYLNNVTLILNTTEYSLPDKYDRGIKFINSGKSRCSHNLIYVRNITIVGSGDINTVYDIGICIYTYAEYYITLVLAESKFHRVYVHPILKCDLFTASSRAVLWIKNCTFQHNIYFADHTKLLIQEPTLDFIMSDINVSVLFTNCLFYNNKNKSPLISIEVFDDNEFHLVDWCLFPSNIQIKQSKFLDNRCSLVNIQRDKESKCITHFSIIGPCEIEGNDGLQQDVISIRDVIVDIIGKVTFSDNIRAKNLILFFSCNVTFYKDIFFIKNGLSHDPELIVDQIITLQSDSAYIKVMENANIKFINNSYYYQAVQVQLENNTPYPFCVFQYDTVGLKNLSDSLVKNYSIYYHGGILSEKRSFQYVFHCRWLHQSIFYI